MLVETTRFAAVEVDEKRLIRFPEGLIGFPRHKAFALISTGERSSFYWLQSVDQAALAFVVTDPRLFISDYQAVLRPEDRQRIGAADNQPLQWLVIVNKAEQFLTGNLQGPLAINPANLQALQIVLAEKRYTTCQPLVQLGPPNAKDRVWGRRSEAREALSQTA